MSADETLQHVDPWRWGFRWGFIPWKYRWQYHEVNGEQKYFWMQREWA